MPEPGMLWRHFIINTFGTWLHGDQRGFRSRKHRIHSSGDYRHPPPLGEHALLHEHHDLRARDEVRIERDLRRTIGQAILCSLLDKHYRLLALAVGKVHTHGLVELPENIPTVKAIIGEAKRVSSRAVRDQLPGNVWAAGGTFKIVTDDAHLARANDYVLYDQGPDAWTWSFRDRSREGMFGRTRHALCEIRGGAGSLDSPALPRRVDG
jgi:REP element-mobilizing transposase RayT